MDPALPRFASSISLPRRAVAALALGFALVAGTAGAGDWPEWRGAGRTGVWNDDGIVESFPDTGLKFLWKKPIGGGYAGPAVAGGKVFAAEFRSESANKGTERLLCLDFATGETVWEHAWPADYTGLSYNVGPRATPTVDGDFVYVLGSVGELRCLKVADGSLVWAKNYLRDFDAELPIWGMACAPLVEGDVLICVAGGQPDAKVVGLDKRTGEERWRALSGNSQPGYVQPIGIDAGGVRQAIVWHPEAVTALDPATGKVLWEHSWKIKMDSPIAQSVWIPEKSRLFLTAFYDGPTMLELDRDKPGARLVWKGKSDNEIDTDGLHACHVTPYYLDDHIYGVCSYGQFRCLKAETGERVWESFGPTVENKRWASAHFVRNGDRFVMNNDRGDLILARLSPEGYEEIDRTPLIKPTTGGAGRREMGAVNWSHPAYADRKLVARNDEEIVCATLAAEDYR